MSADDFPDDVMAAGYRAQAERLEPSPAPDPETDRLEADIARLTAVRARVADMLTDYARHAKRAGDIWEWGEEAILKVRAAFLAASSPPPSPVPDVELWLRQEWWLNHGVGTCQPYGDDGEMQCCSLDFKREPIESLRAAVYNLRLQRVAKALEASPPPSPVPPEQEEEPPLWRHAIQEATEAHLALDRLGAPTTTSIPTRDLTGRHEVTLGLRARIEALPRPQAVPSATPPPWQPEKEQ